MQLLGTPRLQSQLSRVSLCSALIQVWHVQDRIKDRLGLEEQWARILLRLERWGEAEQAYR